MNIAAAAAAAAIVYKAFQFVKANLIDHDRVVVICFSKREERAICFGCESYLTNRIHELVNELLFDGQNSESIVEKMQFDLSGVHFVNL